MRHFINLSVAAAVASAGLLAAAPSMAEEPQARAAVAEDAQFDAKVHSYLVRHPEVLIEMSTVLKKQQLEAQAARAKLVIEKHGDELYSGKDDIAVGPKDADVTIVEFFDYQCPFCKRVAPEIDKLLENDKKVRVVYKQFPILDPVSQRAAAVAQAAIMQGKGLEFHKRMIADETPEHQLTEEHIFEIAKAAGLDVAKLRADSAKPEVAAKLDANVALGREIGVNGTPGLLIGKTLSPGALPYEDIKVFVESERAAAKKK
jgi:protein-disulfide isomerase